METDTGPGNTYGSIVAILQGDLGRRRSIILLDEEICHYATLFLLPTIVNTFLPTLLTRPVASPAPDFVPLALDVMGEIVPLPVPVLVIVPEDELTGDVIVLAALPVLVMVPLALDVTDGATEEPDPVTVMVPEAELVTGPIVPTPEPVTTLPTVPEAEDVTDVTVPLPDPVLPIVPDADEVAGLMVPAPEPVLVIVPEDELVIGAIVPAPSPITLISLSTWKFSPREVVKTSPRDVTKSSYLVAIRFSRLQSRLRGGNSQCKCRD